MKKKIAFIVNSLDFFISHRIEIANQAYKKGYEVIIISDFDKNKIKKELKNFSIYNIKFRSSYYNIFSNINNLFKIYKIFKLTKPDIFHFITIKPILYASILYNFFKNKNIIVSFSGLGYLSINKNFTTKIFNYFFSILLNKLFKIKNIYVIFQNKNDIKFISSKAFINKNKIILIKGSGVNLKIFKYSKFVNSSKIKFLLITRLLYDKGVYEFIKASNLLIEKKYAASFTIIGSYDVHNPSNLKKGIVEKWNDNNNKKFLGYKSNILKYIQNSHVVVLPSYREGMPKVLLEASAIGRAIITTNVPGCKECVKNNLNGYLVEANSVDSLSKAMIKIIKNKKNLVKMGKASRNFAIKNYSIEKVINTHLKLYESFKKN